MKWLQINNSTQFKTQYKTRLLCLILLITFSAMAQDIKSEFISLPNNNIELHYLASENQKNNQAIVLVHGLGSYSKAYLKNINELAKHANVFAIDLPGFGESGLGGFIPGMKNYASVISQFAIEKKLKNVILVGHSMGGQIVATLAINENPKWLKSVILLSPAGIETFSDSDKTWFSSVITNDLYLNLTNEQIKQNFNVNFYGAQLPEDANFMLEDRLLIKENEDKYKQYCNTIVTCIHAMLNEPIYDKISSINVSVQVIFGQNDLLIPNKILHPNPTLTDLTDKLKNDYPKVEITLLDKSGHFIQWDKSEAINTIIINEIKN
ncbi:alpha/beta hydrolase [Gaetbulibacter sp. M235]